MIVEAQLAPRNSILFVMDQDSGELPKQFIPGQLVNATPSCVVVGTLCEVDGETRLMLTDEAARIQEIAGLRRVFSGPMATPKNVIHVCTSQLETVATLSVAGTRCTVEIWANDESEPDRICVLVRQ
jgi:hypothetical protein